ncbi:zinc-finger-containing protein [Caballeronia sp. LZ001]|uniref:zinc-finger-containing protein n=1 Tax=Caballeronia sp. LZ001 TaxID=3038553 RepID=UPI00285C2369|nr:zinc-finger-containing protein [Caballeronia sp. LZ001]MDR5806700.1 zinc-finger-containing protein [Caballeronia sp. LZ001]
MRIGKPIKPLPHPDCDYCGNPAVLARAGDDAYPYRDDHGPLWLCQNCHAWIGVFPRSKRNVPLGRLADARLRELKAKLHTALEPLVAAKVRRDGCNVFEARAKAMKWLAGEIGADVEKCSIHTLDADQCARAIVVVDEFQRARTATASSEPAWEDR